LADYLRGCFRRLPVRASRTPSGYLVGLLRGSCGLLWGIGWGRAWGLWGLAFILWGFGRVVAFGFGFWLNCLIGRVGRLIIRQQGE
jgi:hypothetical protein